VVDNAASAVAMVEAAKLLRGVALKHRVRVLLTDQEEQGLLGARAWIARHGVAQLAGVINADVAAYGETLMYGLNNGAQSKGLVRALREVCAERAMDCEGYTIYPPSEDRAFSAAGAPVVSIGFQDAVGARQMWLMMNTPNTGFAQGFRPKVFATIHTPADTLTELDPATVARAAEVFANLVRKIDAAN
jgi:Zn-dependent M28 family amino/carboxypeptidase